MGKGKSKSCGGKVARGRKSQSKITSVIHVKIILWEAHNFIGGKWEEVEWEERNRILFGGGEISVGNGERSHAGEAHKLWQSMGCQRFRRKMLEKILGRGVEEVHVIPGNPWG